MRAGLAVGLWAEGEASSSSDGVAGQWVGGGASSSLDEVEERSSRFLHEAPKMLWSFGGLRGGSWLASAAGRSSSSSLA